MSERVRPASACFCIGANKANQGVRVRNECQEETHVPQDLHLLPNKTEKSISLSLPVEEIFGSNHPYSAPSLCFSAAGAIATMLFFCINAFKEAKSLD